MNYKYVILLMHILKEGCTMPRENITFKCSVCGEENYLANKNKRLHPDRVEYNKYCPRCNKKTVHKEKK